MSDPDGATARAALSRVAGRERGDRAAKLAIVVVALAAAVAWGALSPSGANDLIGGDEGYYGTMARNVLAAPGQVVSPSLTPLGPPGDKPPLYPLLIAPFVRAWGATPVAVRAPSALCACAIPLGVGLLLVPQEDLLPFWVILIKEHN